MVGMDNEESALDETPKGWPGNWYFPKSGDWLQRQGEKLKGRGSTSWLRWLTDVMDHLELETENILETES